MVGKFLVNKDICTYKATNITSHADNVADEDNDNLNIIQAAFNAAFEEAKSGGLAAKQAMMIVICFSYTWEVFPNNPSF